MRKARAKQNTDDRVGREWVMRDASAATGSEFGVASAVDLQALVAEFSDGLADSTLDREQRDALVAEFERAARDAAADPAAGSGSPPTRADWLDTVEVLRKSGAIDEEHGNALVRELDEALQPIKQKNVQLAVEFSQRLQQDGLESALQWFKQQSTASSDNAGATASHHPRVDGLDGSNLITQSRSRRLRGPPGSQTPT